MGGKDTLKRQTEKGIQKGQGVMSCNANTWKDEEGGSWVQG